MTLLVLFCKEEEIGCLPLSLGECTKEWPLEDLTRNKILTKNLTLLAPNPSQNDEKTKVGV